MTKEELAKRNLENARLALACAQQELERTDEDNRREVKTIIHIWNRVAHLYRPSTRDLAIRILAAGTAIERGGEMNPEEINQIIADFCEIDCDFFHSLNAIHEAEKHLSHEQCVAYHNEIDHAQAEVTNMQDGNSDYPAQIFWFHSSSELRAKCFVRAIGKWRETK